LGVGHRVGAWSGWLDGAQHAHRGRLALGQAAEGWALFPVVERGADAAMALFHLLAEVPVGEHVVLARPDGLEHAPADDQRVEAALGEDAPGAGRILA